MWGRESEAFVVGALLSCLSTSARGGNFEHGARALVLVLETRGAALEVQVQPGASGSVAAQRRILRGHPRCAVSGGLVLIVLCIRFWVLSLHQYS